MSASELWAAIRYHDERANQASEGSQERAEHEHAARVAWRALGALGSAE